VLIFACSNIYLTYSPSAPGVVGLVNTEEQHQRLSGCGKKSFSLFRTLLFARARIFM